MDSQHCVCKAHRMRGSVVSPKLAIAMLPAAFLVPLVSSPLAGLTHVPACRIPPGDPVAVSGFDEAAEIAASALSIDNSTADGVSLCPGIDVLLSVTNDSNGSVRITLPVTNNSSSAVNVTSDLHIDDDVRNIALGRIEPGKIGVKVVVLPSTRSDRTFSAGLFVGPA